MKTETCSIEMTVDRSLLLQMAEACEAPLWLLDQKLNPMITNAAAVELGVNATNSHSFFQSPIWQKNCHQAFRVDQLDLEARLELQSYRFSFSRFQQGAKTYLLVRADRQSSDSLDLKRLQQMIDFIPDAVFVKNRQHQWVLVNWAFCQLMGQSPEALLGKSDFDFLPAEQAEVFWENDNKAFEKGGLSVNEECLTNTAGGYFGLLIKKLVIYSDDQEALLVCTATDITERKKLEDKLAEACSSAELSSAAKTDILAKTSHEMRTSLSVILGFSQILQVPESHDPDAHQFYLSRIHQNGLHLLHLINDLLDLSRIENGQLNIQYETCDLNLLMKTIAETFQARIAEHNLCLNLDLSPITFKTDPLRLLQVVSNLVDNAIKHTPAGEITLRNYCSQPGFLIIEVKDTGSGIAPDVQSSVFELFQQEDPSSDGVGLGLAISQQICEELGYQLILVASSPQGSCFQIRIKI